MNRGYMKIVLYNCGEEEEQAWGSCGERELRRGGGTGKRRSGKKEERGSVRLCGWIRHKFDR